jgi:hypothetical protein
MVWWLLAFGAWEALSIYFLVRAFKARSLYYGTYWALMVEFVPCAAIL